MLHRLFAIIRILFFDGIRRNILLGLIVFGIFGELSGIIFADFFGRDIGRAAVDYSLSIIWLCGLAFLFFYVINIVAWADDRKIIYSLLARPISRSEYVIGIFLGLSTLFLLLNLLLGASSFAVLFYLKQLFGSLNFPALSLTAFAWSIAGLILMQLCLLTVILLLTALLRGSLVISMMSLAYYAICSGLPVIRNFVDEESAFATFLQALTFAFPNFSRLDFKDFITSNDMLPALSVPVGEFVFSISYMILILLSTCWLYKQRDIY